MIMSGFWLGTSLQEILAVAFDGTMVLMPTPWKPPYIPTTSRVGLSHLSNMPTLDPISKWMQLLSQVLTSRLFGSSSQLCLPEGL